MKLGTHWLQFSTGKAAYCNGVVGLDIASSNPGDRLSFGYDGHIPTHRDADYCDGASDQVLTDDECRELAEYMIKAWTDYRDGLTAIRG